MPFLVFEMIVCLLAAAAVGLALGWILRLTRTRRRIRDAELRWQRRLHVADEELADRSAALSEALSRVEDKRSLLVQAEQKQRELSTLLSESVETVEALSDVVDQKQSRVDSITGELDDLRSRVTESVHELNAARAAVSARSADLEQTIDRVGELEKAISDANRREGVLEDSLQATRSTLEQLELRLADALNELENERGRRQRESGTVGELKGLLADRERVAIELMVERDALVSARETQAAELERKDRHTALLLERIAGHSSLLDEIASKSGSTDEMLSLLEEHVLNRDSDMSALRSELAESEATVANLEAANRHLRERVDEMTSGLKRRDADVAVLRADIAERIDSIRTMEGRIRDLERTCGDLVGRSESLGSQRTELQREVALLQSGLRDREQLRTETARLQREARALDAQVRALESDLQHRRRMSKANEEALESARRRLADREAEAIKLRERLAQLARVARQRSPGGSALLLDGPDGEPDNLKS